MRCHANARLSPIGRRLLVDRVERDGWTVRAAAERGGQRADRAQVAGAVAAGGRGGAGGSLLGAAAGGQPHRRADGRGDRRAAAVADDGAGDRRAARACRSRRSRGSCSAMGMGRLGRLGLEPARRYQRDRPGELIHIDIKKLGRIQRRRRQTDHRRLRRTTSRTRTDRQRQAPQDGRLGVRAHRHRRRHPTGLRRSAGRREGHDRDRRSCVARSPF